MRRDRCSDEKKEHPRLRNTELRHSKSSLELSQCRNSKAPFNFVLNLMVPGAQKLALVITWAAEQNPSLSHQNSNSSAPSLQRDHSSVSSHADSDSEAGSGPFDILLARYFCPIPLGKQFWSCILMALLFTAALGSAVNTQICLVFATSASVASCIQWKQGRQQRHPISSNKENSYDNFDSIVGFWLVMTRQQTGGGTPSSSLYPALSRGLGSSSKAWGIRQCCWARS